MCGVKLNERKKTAELKISVRSGTSQFDDQKSRLRILRWFGYVEHKDANDWVKHCTTLEVEEMRQRECPRKTWWDCLG